MIFSLPYVPWSTPLALLQPFRRQEVRGKHVCNTSQGFQIRLPQGMVQWEAVDEKEVRSSVHRARLQRGDWRVVFHTLPADSFAETAVTMLLCCGTRGGDYNSGRVFI